MIKGKRLGREIFLRGIKGKIKSIYSSKNSNFEVIEIVNQNENKNSFLIEKTVMAISNNEAQKKLKLEIDYQQLTTTILKNSKGDPSKN